MPATSDRPIWSRRNPSLRANVSSAETARGATPRRLRLDSLRGPNALPITLRKQGSF